MNFAFFVQDYNLEKGIPLNTPSGAPPGNFYNQTNKTDNNHQASFITPSPTSTNSITTSNLLPSHDFNESSIALSALPIDSSSTKSSNKNALKQQHQQRKSEPETNTKAISVSSNCTTNNLLTTSTSNHVHSTNTNGHQQNFGNSAQNTKAAFPFTSPTLPVKTKSKAGF